MAVLLLSACGKDKPPIPPKPVEAAKPLAVEAARLNAAEPVLLAAPQAVPDLQVPPAASAPPGASAADWQALRSELERQREADKAGLDGLQERLAALEANLARLEARLAASPPADKPKAARPEPAKPKTAAPPTGGTASSRQAKPSAPKEALPPLPFYLGSVDTWDGEKQVMVRADGQWQALKPGETWQGWRVESVDGQMVTLCNPQGRCRQVRARQDG